MLKFSTQTKQKSFSSLFKNKQQLNCSNIAGPSNGNNNTQGGENYVPAPTVAVLSTVNTQPLTIIPIYGSPTPPIPRRLTLSNQTAKQQRFSNSSSQSTSTTTISQSVPSSSTTTTSSSSSISPSSKTSSSSSPPSCPPPSSSSGSLGSILTNSNTSSKSSRIFPSTRFFIALLLCLCYISLSISTSNISVSMVCMIKRTSAQFQQVQQQQQMQSLQPNNNNNQNNMQYGINQINEQEKEKSDVFILLRRRKREKDNIQQQQQQINSTSTSKQLLTEKQSECANSRRRRKHLNNNNREIRSTVYFESCHEAEKLSWSSTDQGIVFAAQNAGSLFMLFTGAHADRLNSKWTISGALILLVLSNALLPLVASISVWLVVVARLLTGLSDALLQPSTSSLITRWFPPKERPFAIGLITGGRQIGWLVN
ncbi:unnamed protein product [Meloidogyne enterolobii]|uniref:Uncharacterized protein n=1 Tax=Meloidogyne enterolobii TaxID=390850 RepID=A0ACB0YNF9_MELEN